jgi:hypothetical protein
VCILIGPITKYNNTYQIQAEQVGSWREFHERAILPEFYIYFTRYGEGLDGPNLILLDGMICTVGEDWRLYLDWTD